MEIDPNLLTGAVRGIVESIEADMDYQFGLPILADALEEAGDVKIAVKLREFDVGVFKAVAKAVKKVEAPCLT